MLKVPFPRGNTDSKKESQENKVMCNNEYFHRVNYDGKVYKHARLVMTHYPFLRLSALN